MALQPKGLRQDPESPPADAESRGEPVGLGLAPPVEPADGRVSRAPVRIGCYERWPLPDTAHRPHVDRTGLRERACGRVVDGPPPRLGVLLGPPVLPAEVHRVARATRTKELPVRRDEADLCLARPQVDRQNRGSRVRRTGGPHRHDHPERRNRLSKRAPVGPGARWAQAPDNSRVASAS